MWERKKYSRKEKRPWYKWFYNEEWENLERKIRIWYDRKWGVKERILQELKGVVSLELVTIKNHRWFMWHFGTKEKEEWSWNLSVPESINWKT